MNVVGDARLHDFNRGEL